MLIILSQFKNIIYKNLTIVRVYYIIINFTIHNNIFYLFYYIIYLYYRPIFTVFVGRC